jgi:hypothetical protein
MLRQNILITCLFIYLTPSAWTSDFISSGDGPINIIPQDRSADIKPYHPSKVIKRNDKVKTHESHDGTVDSHAQPGSTGDGTHANDGTKVVDAAHKDDDKTKDGTHPSDEHKTASAAHPGDNNKTLDAEIKANKGISDKDLTDLITTAGTENVNLSLDLSNCGDVVTDATLQTIADKCPKIMELNLTSCNKVTDAGIKVLVDHCKELRKMDLSRTAITDVSVLLAAYECQHLNWLGLEQVPVSDLAIDVLATRRPGIMGLNLNLNPKLTEASFQSLASKCPHLEELHLSGNDNVTDASIQALASKCQKLSKLTLDKCSKITDVAVKAIANKLSNLEGLNLISCTNVTDGSIQELISDCKKLKTLELTGSGVSEATLEGIRAKHPDLKIIFTQTAAPAA